MRPNPTKLHHKYREPHFEDLVALVHHSSLFMRVWPRQTVSREILGAFHKRQTQSGWRGLSKLRLRILQWRCQRFEDVVFGGFQSPRRTAAVVSEIVQAGNPVHPWSACVASSKPQSLIHLSTLLSEYGEWRLFHALIRLIGTKRYLMLICLERY